MFNRALAYFLISLNLFANSGSLLVYADFSINQKEIAAKFCINKDKPEMHCNGKCYLKKRLKEAEEKERSQDLRMQKDRMQEALICNKIQLNSPVGFEIKTYISELPFKLPTNHQAIFHPPKAIILFIA